MNKKGFTLIELLAVITILGIVMLIAAIGVIPVMTKSKNDALFDEGKTLVHAAELAYSDNKQMVGKNVCISLEWLHDKNFFDKGIEDGYSGSVYIEYNGGELIKKYTIKSEIGTIGYETKSGATAWQNMNNMQDKNAKDYVLSKSIKESAKHYEAVCYSGNSSYAGTSNINEGQSITIGGKKVSIYNKKL